MKEGVDSAPRLNELHRVRHDLNDHPVDSIETGIDIAIKNHLGPFVSVSKSVAQT